MKDSLKDLYAEAIQAQIHADVRAIFCQKEIWIEQETKKLLTPLEIWLIDHIQFKAVKKFVIRHIEIKEYEVTDGKLIKIYRKGRFITEKIFKPIRIARHYDWCKPKEGESHD